MQLYKSYENSGYLHWVLWQAGWQADEIQVKFKIFNPLTCISQTSIDVLLSKNQALWEYYTHVSKLAP